MFAVGRRENSEFEVEHLTMIMFFSHNPLYRKKALCVISLVWSQGASVFQIPPAAALPFSAYKVQGVGFRVVLHILFFVHEATKNDELSPPLYHCVKAGLRWPCDCSRSPISVHSPGHHPSSFGPGHIQHVHLHGFAVERLVQRFPYVQALRRVMAKTPCNGWDSMSISSSSLWRAGGWWRRGSRRTCSSSTTTTSTSSSRRSPLCLKGRRWWWWRW